MPTNIFFRDLVQIPKYRESLQQYLAAVERKNQREVKNTTLEEKPVYRSYVKLERHSLQAQWDTGAQISVCTKLLVTKLGLKWTKLEKELNMVTIDRKKSPSIRIVENAGLKILDIKVLINIHIVDSTKEKLLLRSNWFAKYKADLILSENLLKFQAEGKKFQVKIVNTPAKDLAINWYKEDEDIEVISVEDDSDKGSVLSEQAANWLNRFSNFREENWLTDEAVEEWLEAIESMKVKEVPLVEEENSATYLTHTWQWNSMQDMLHLKEERDYLLYEITDTYPEEVQKILEEYDDIVSKGAHDIRNCTSVEHIIRLISEVPVVGKMGYPTPREHKWIDEKIEIMLKNGVIEESSSPYAFNVVVVGKKDGAGEGMDRLCINYALLNKVTIPD